MQTLLLSCAWLVIASCMTPDEKWNRAIDDYNATNAAELGKLLKAFDEAVQNIKDYKDASATSEQKELTLKSLEQDKKKFMENGRLPESANLIVARYHYHRAMHQHQKKLQKLIEEAKAGSLPMPTATLLLLKEILNSQLPDGSKMTASSIWKGYRYTPVLRRFLYELTPTAIVGTRFSGVMRFQSNEWEVEGTLEGPFLQFEITKVKTGSRGAQRGFQGVILGNRLLMKVSIGGESPMILYLQ